MTEQLEAHRKAWREKASQKDARSPPLVLGVQGPQGSGASDSRAMNSTCLDADPSHRTGKSYLASGLPALLASQNPPLRTASLSLDDLYLPHSGLSAVAQADPSNKLLSGRGQAGTHDLALGLECLRALKAGGTEPVELPVFEKSLHGGEGDRLPREQWVKVDNPGEVDVVVFEGWMNGFRPLPSPPADHSLSALYSLARNDRQQARTALGIDYDEPFLLEHDLAHLEKVQGNLAAYEELWGMIDAFVQIKPERMGYVWEWRLEVRPLALACATHMTVDSALTQTRLKHTARAQHEGEEWRNRDDGRAGQALYRSVSLHHLFARCRQLSSA